MNENIEKPTIKLPPLKRMCMTIGQLPSSYVETMSYYEMLVWFINYLRDEVIPVVNANGEAVEELQGLYTQLQEYVNNYFDNLDVQEEINNKLDEMAESGQLTDIIAQYLGLAGMITFNNVAEMKAAENLVNGSKCCTLGYYEVNDGGQAFYKVRNVTNEDEEDDMFIIALQDESLVAELIISDEINIKQIGAKIDGITDDTTTLQSALDHCSKIFIPSGTCLISQPLEINSNTKLYGIKDSSIIKAISTFEEHSFKCLLKNKNSVQDLSETHNDSIIIENLKFDNNGKTNAGTDGLIQFRGVTNSSIKNVDMNVQGNNCWGIILFSANQNITIDNININNTSEDNSLGGCLWIRSGLNYNDTITRKTFGINVTNSNFTSTAKDEIISISDGVAGGWTEANLNNCTLYGKATTTYSSYLLVVNAINNTSIVKVNINNLNLIGKVTQAGIVHGHTGIPFANCKGTYNNITINLESANYGIRSYNREQIFSNCNIKTPSNKPTVNNCTIINSYLNGTLTSSNVYNCIIDSDNVGPENCPNIKNCIIYANSYGIKYYGGIENACVQNNNIFANTYGIYGQVVNSVGIKRGIISGNNIQRKDSSSNAGSIGINLQYSDTTQIINNLTYGSTGNVSAEIIGFQYANNTSNSTNITKELNTTYSISS